MSNLMCIAKEVSVYAVLLVCMYGARVARARNNELLHQIESLRMEVNECKKKRSAFMAEYDRLAHPERIKRIVIKLKLGLRPIE